jgi:hypothetical protein
MSIDIDSQPVTGTVDPIHLQANMRKVAMTALAGASIEWYDFFLYATAAALVFPSAFFPDSTPTPGHWGGFYSVILAIVSGASVPW